MTLRRLMLFLLLACCSFLGRAANAQPLVQAPSVATVQQSTGSAPAYLLPPAKLKKAIELNRKRITIDVVDTTWTILQLILILYLGIAAWMRRVAVGLSRNRWAQGFTFYFLFLTLTSLLSLPVDIYGHQVSLDFGQSVQQWPGWFADKGKTFVLTFGVGGLLVMLLFLCIGRSPRRWWFWYWIPTMASVVFGVFITPVLINPLFDKFDPLQQSNPALVTRLEEVVARGGVSIPPDRMFLMKASAKVTGLNAYVTGIGASKRVVVWDTSIAKATPDEISFIFGHEMGHYVLNHIYKGLAFSAIGLLLLFFVGFHCVQFLIVRFGASWGIPDQHNWAALVVIMLVLSLLSFFADPIANTFSRSQEHAADVYGQEAVHGIVADPQAVAAHSFQVLGEESLVDPTPHPLIQFWTGSHPTIPDRAAFAAKYNPWAPGQQPAYFKK